MSEKKSVSKSIRLTPELYEFITQYDGNGFNEKFSNIISYCFKKEPEIKRSVQQQETRLAQLNTQIQEKRALLQKLQNLEYAINEIVSESPNTEPKKEKILSGQEQFF